jgi:hypothetical protein
MNEPLIISRNKVGLELFFTILGIVVFGGISYLLISSQFNDKTYPELFILIAGGFFGFFAIIIFLFIFRIYKVFVFEDKILKKSIFGHSRNIIYYDEIIDYTEIVKDNTSGNWSEFTLHTNNKSFSIISKDYENYYELCAFLKSKSVLNKTKSQKIKDKTPLLGKIVIACCVTFLICFLCLLFNMFLHRNETLNYNELSQISGHVTNKIEVSKTARGSRSIHIFLDNYPEFNFGMSGSAYSALEESKLLENVKIGNELTLKIKTDDYEKKITKRKELGFFDKYSDYRHIGVYELSDNKYTYLHLDDYNIDKKNDVTYGTPLLILLLLISFIYTFKNVKKTSKSKVENKTSNRKKSKR